MCPTDIHVNFLSAISNTGGTFFCFFIEMNLCEIFKVLGQVLIADFGIC